MKIIPVTILFILVVRSYGQSVTMQEIIQSRLMARDSFIAYYSSKGFEQRANGFGGELEESVSMILYSGKESITLDTLPGGVPYVRYFNSDTNSVDIFADQLCQFKLISQSSDPRYSYINYKKLYQAESVGIEFSMIDGYSRVIVMPYEKLIHSITKSVKADRIDSTLNVTETGKGNNNCPDADVPESSKKSVDAEYKLERQLTDAYPDPDTTHDINGKIIVVVWVDRNGNVTKAVAGAIGTTLADQKLWKECEEKAMMSKFTSCHECPLLREEKITYQCSKKK